jgi:hypothetical protein
MAEVIEATDQEARWVSAQSNLTHGEPLKAEGASRGVQSLSQGWPVEVPGQARQDTSEIVAGDRGGPAWVATIVKWMRQDFRAIWKQMGGEVVAAPGEKEPANQAEQRMDEALQHLIQVEAIVKTLTEPEHRGRVLAALARAGKALAEAGPCEPLGGRVLDWICY